MAESGKLYGVPLNVGVRTQLGYRASNLAATDKDVQQLMVDNNRGAWVSLASSAQTLSEETIKYTQTLKKHLNSGWADNEAAAKKYLETLEAAKSQQGNQLAQGNILNGGVLYPRISASNKLRLERRTGIDFSKRYNPFGNQSSYEHNPEFGFQPMMGITDFKIVTQSAFGTLRKATVTIKAFSPDQLSILEALYFRPGFSMLLEWGNSSYIDKYGEISSYNLGMAKTFTIGNIKAKEIENEDGKKEVVTAIQQMKEMIQENREFSGYNYDGMIGKVVNFSWKLANDQSYDCSIDIQSEGMVIDAVKTVFTPSTDTSLDKYKSGDQAETAATSDDLLIDALEIFKNPNKRPEYIKNEYPDSKIRAFYGDSFYVAAEPTEEGEARYNNDRHYYLTLRDFCYVFNKQILEKQNTGNISLKFSTKFNKSVMTTFPGHISNDPGICVMPFRDGEPYEPNPKSSNISFTKEINLYGGLQDKFGTTIFKPKPKKWEHNYQKSNIHRIPLEAGEASVHLPVIYGDEFSHDSPYKILVNIDHLIRIQESFKDQANEDHEVKAVVSQFFNRLLSDLNTALGGINNLACFFDEDNNEWIIIDHNCFDLQAGSSKERPASEPPLLNIIGLKTEVTKLDIQSKISNEMFNMLAVTATASGQKIEDSIDNFSRYNANVSDRYEPLVKPPVATNKKTSSQNWKEAKDINILKQIAQPWHRYINGNVATGLATQKKIYSAEAFDSAKQAHAQYMKALNDQREGKTREAGTKRPFNGGLLPIELSLTMRGISGLKIGEAFLINETLLPQRSRGLIGFSITGIDHSISLDNQWLTNITTAMYNLPDTEIPVEDEYEEPYKAPEAPPVEGPKETPNANRLRGAIAAAGYLEKQKKGASSGELTSAIDAITKKSSQVDITKEMADYGIALIKVVKREVPGITLTFTGGNDKFHHGLGYTSRHVLGRALDFVISPYSTEAYKKVLSVIESFTAGENDQARFKDEYKKMTTSATAPHFHISWGKGTEGKRELATAIKKAEKGEITSRKV